MSTLVHTLCACGCGQTVEGIERQARRGRAKGEPVLFIRGHNARKAPHGQRWCGGCEQALDPTAFSPGHTRCKECRNADSRKRTAQRPPRVRKPRGQHTGPQARSLRSKLRRRGADETTVDYALDVLAADLCVYCGGAADTFDHIEATAAGGGGTWENLASACCSCNSRKRTTPVLVFLARRH